MPSIFNCRFTDLLELRANQFLYIGGPVRRRRDVGDFDLISLRWPSHTRVAKTREHRGFGRLVRYFSTDHDPARRAAFAGGGEAVTAPVPAPVVLLARPAVFTAGPHCLP